MFSPRHPALPGSRLFGLLVLLLSAALVLTAGATPVRAATTSERARPATVAQTDQGRMTSLVKGRTSTGQRVTGTFTPLRVARRHGELVVKGLVQGVVQEGAGRTSTFSAVRSIPIKAVNGNGLSRSAAGTAVSARATCDILNLVLGPLDLNLLGLEVHLKRVVLDVLAVTGAGNLLGNLLCAVAGLLDGSPLAGLLGQLGDLLNQILAALRLGV